MVLDSRLFVSSLEWENPRSQSVRRVFRSQDLKPRLWRSAPRSAYISSLFSAAACRTPSKAKEVIEALKTQTGNPNVDILRLDLASLDAIRQFAKEYQSKYKKIDQLILNAGTWPEVRRTTADGFEECFGVNHLGHMYLTHLLLPLVRKSEGDSGRIVVLSSKQHTMGAVDWNDLQFERKPFAGMQAYQQAKIANVLFAKELGAKLKAQGSSIVVSSVHPGVIKTELHRDASGVIQGLLTIFAGLLGKTIPQGVQTTLYGALSSDLKDKSGHYLADCKITPPNPKEVTEANAKRLWDLSCKMLSIPTEWK